MGEECIDVMPWHRQECPSCGQDGIVHHNHDDRWCTLCQNIFGGRPCCRLRPDGADAWIKVSMVNALGNEDVRHSGDADHELVEVTSRVLAFMRDRDLQYLSVRRGS